MCAREPACVDHPPKEGDMENFSIVMERYIRIHLSHTYLPTDKNNFQSVYLQLGKKSSKPFIQAL